MTEWSDFIESLPEETSLIIELTMALEKCKTLLTEDKGIVNWVDINPVLEAGQKYKDQFVR